MEKNKLISGIVIALILIVGGIAAFHLIQPKEPTIEEANIILDESIEKTFALTSFTAKGDADFQVKSGETVLVKVVMRDMQFLMTDVWDFANPNSKMVITYDVMMNLTAIADFIEANVPSEELESDINPDMPMDPDVPDVLDMFMGMDPIATLRTIGTANVAVIMEMKSIDNDSYMKITEVTGLRETITSVAGAFVAEMVMGGIEPKIGIWIKTPADPTLEEEMRAMSEKIKPLMDIMRRDLSGVLFVERVLSNATVNNRAVYNFTTGIDLDKTKDFVISLIPVIGETVEIDDVKIAEIKQNINENWPKVIAVMQALEIKDNSTYICRETKFIIKERGTVNVDLYRIITALEPMIIKDMTPEELADFNKDKESVRNISVAVTGNFTYSDHNAVPTIMPPAEYQLIENIIPAPEF